jgi:RNA polymerase sigma-70 factor (ECF subfamily)
VTSEPERTRQQVAAPPDVDDLMRRVAGGDREAFAALYDAIASRVYGLIRRVIRDTGLAEEVAQ